MERVLGESLSNAGVLPPKQTSYVEQQLLLMLNLKRNPCGVHLDITGQKLDKFENVTSIWGPTPLAKSADSMWEWVLGKELSCPWLL